MAQEQRGGRTGGIDGRFGLAFLVVLAGLSGALLPGSVPDRLRSAEGFLGLAAAGWLAGTVMAARGLGDLRLVVFGAIALRLVALAGDPQLSDDVYRYVWEGDLLAQGTSPYAFPPDSPRLAAQQERLAEVYAALNNRGISAAYPPLVQYVLAAVASVAHLGREAPGLVGVLAMRIAFACFDLLVLVPLAFLLRRRGRPVALAVVWGWSPLVALEFAGSGHFDSLGILLLVGGLALVPGTARERSADPALALLAGAFLVKLLPGLALPFVLRQGRAVRGALVFLAVCGLAYVPILLLPEHGRGLFHGLGQYGLRWEGGSLVFRWVDAAIRSQPGLFDANPQLVSRGVVGLAWLGFLLHAYARVPDPVRATGRVLAAFLVLTPTLHPWYLTWIVPFLALRPSLALFWLASAAPLLYWPVAGWQAQGVWAEPAWLWWVLAPTFFALLTVDATRRRAYDSPDPA